MKILPAIDIFEQKAVRLFKGDYNQMTVYSNDPVSVASSFSDQGAEYIHLVDLEGAKKGSDSNFSVVASIIQNCGIPCEIGGGIRDMETVEKYVSAGADRVILGTAAVNNKSFLQKAVDKYGKKIAVGADVRDNMVAVSGWLETTGLDVFDFILQLKQMGVQTVICTDISKDGALSGTNRQLYCDILARTKIDLIASGGVTDTEDIKALVKTGVSGAILGKALYNGNITLTEALAAAKEEK